MSSELYPSGPWVGFYNYQPGDRHRMQLNLTFTNGVISGDGNDDIGRFLIKGRYDCQVSECYWTKTYLGAHDVFYRGFRERKGIWGTWEITSQQSVMRGGFHIWPKGMPDPTGQTLSAEADLPAQEKTEVKEEELVGAPP